MLHYDHHFSYHQWIQHQKLPLVSVPQLRWLAADVASIVITTSSGRVQLLGSMPSLWWSLLGVGAVAKVVPLIEGSWRYIGGGAIVFQAIKTYIFGKLIRTIEYPDGDMVSFIIRHNNFDRFKWDIIERQPPFYPGAELVAKDIRYVARWTPPHFTELCYTKQDLKLVPDGGIVFWSREDPIPRRGVTLDLKDKEAIKVDVAIKFVTRMGSKLVENAQLTQAETDQLVELLVERDEGILTLHRNFHQQPELFKHYALRYLQRKQQSKKS